MTWRRYPKYKDSGVEWLGEVPGHWDVKRLKHVIRKLESGVSVNSEASPADESSVGILKTSCVYGDAFDPSENKQVVDEELVRVACPVAGNTLIISRMNTPALVGSCGYVDKPYPRLFLPDRLWQARFSPYTTAQPKFFWYVLTCNALKNEISLLATGTSDSMQNIVQADILCLPIPVPTRPEQETLTKHLDRETVKIDTLIAKQERLIELLQEKRQALISHAVTKGLNPDTPMKPSGVEWLGDVPAHWTVRRIKWVAQMESGHTPDKKIDAYWENCDIPWVSLNDTAQLRVKDYVDDTAFKVNALGIANSSARLLPQGTVVFSRDATVGLCAITNRVMAVSQHFIAWVCGTEILAAFLLFALRSMDQELSRRTMGATVKTIGMPDVRTLVAPVPPVDEQQKIVSHILEQRERLDRTIGKTQSSIALLRERRTALISAAVTGKIDVRGPSHA